ncbi:MAG: TolC family protein [Planctomycetia bacterium]|nr:TolC family protein [Planctomycetia bacterium]
MMRRNRRLLLAACATLLSVTATARGQQFAEPALFAPPAPPFESVAPAADHAVQQAVHNPAGYPGAGYQRATVGDRYADTVGYQYGRPTGDVVPAVALVNARREAPAEAVPLSQAPSFGGPAVPILPPTTFRLDDLVGIAIEQNPILRREQARIDGAKGDRVQAGLYENPIMFTNNPEIWAGQSTFVNFGFKQKIAVKGKMRLEKAAADQAVRFQTAEYRLERARMLTEVRKQYYKTLAAKHRIYLARHLTGLAERGVGGARQLQNAGEGSLTDVLLLDTEYQREQINLRNAETNFQGELKQLAAIVGSSGIIIEDIDGTIFDAPPEFNESDVQDFVANDSSYAERARADLTQKQTELRRAEVDPYPDLELGPHYVAGTLPSSAQYWFTVEFQIPVWNLNQGNIRKSNAAVHKSIAARRTTYNENHKKVSELFAEYRAARQRAERIRIEILPNAQEAQRLVQDAYVKGQFNVNRLLKSQHNLATVSSEYFDAAEKAWDTAAEIAGMLQLEQFP